MHYYKNNIPPGELTKNASDVGDAGDKSEIQIQAEAFQWAWNYLPQTRRLLFHVPNGGSRNVKEAGQLKASGVVAGVPDIVLLWKGRAYGFEFKTRTGALSPVQREVHAAWSAAGVPVAIVRSLEEFQNALMRVLEGGL